ncbi:MAG: protein TolR [Pseudomonadales bacterium]|nr:protein TolR [Pseudomonadales bacterium]
MSSRKNKRRLVAEINVVPYIDVMLVLLIVFMATATVLMQGVQVDLPQAPSSTINEKDEPLIVSIKQDGSLYINLGRDEKNAVPLETIQQQVAKIMRTKPQTPILVWGDKNVDYGKVVELMTQLQIAGAESVGLVTEPPTIQ